MPLYNPAASAGAPTDAPYYTNAAVAGLSAEVVPSANLISFLGAATYNAARDLLLGVTTTAAGMTLLDDADAAAQRTTLGLGTAATVNTGTSGATIPLLNGTNTFSGTNTINTLIVNGTSSSGSGSLINFTGAFSGSTAARVFSVINTWNTSGAPKAFFANITNTASDPTARLLDLQVSSVSQHSVDLSGNQINLGTLDLGHATDTKIARAAAGRLTVATVALMRGPASGTDNAIVRMDGTTGDLSQNSVALVDDTTGIVASAADAGGFDIGASRDVKLRRGAANRLELINSTNAQTLRVYNTDDGAGNNEWGALTWSANTLFLQSSKTGTGTDRGITLLPGSGTLTMQGHFVPHANGSDDLGTDALAWRSLYIDETNTAAGTTGAQTINKAAGSVNFAAAATSLVVTNSLVATTSMIYCTVATNDTTATLKNVVAASGSFTITLTAAANAETKVNFLVIN